MPSKRQIDANRRNAQKSTGPTSPQGKALSSMNALKTGLYAKSEVLPCENRAEYEQLIERYYNDHRPASALACQYLDEIIYCTWNLRRLRRAEAQLWDFVHGDSFQPDDEMPLGQVCANNPKVFSQLQWRMDANRRALDRAVKSLRETQAADREAAESGPVPAPSPATVTIQTTSPQIGFVPVTPSERPAGPAVPIDGPTPQALRNRPGLDPRQRAIIL
jgi:hypothetical protein